MNSIRQASKIFFLVLVFLNFSVNASENLSDLEGAILNSDVEKVKTALAVASLTERDKIGLIDLTHDIILKRLKDIECIRFGHLADIKEYQEETWAPTGIFFLGLGGGFLSFCIAKIASEESDVIALAGGAVGTIISAGAFIGGLAWLFIRAEAFKKKVNQAHTDAIIIKKLIHNKVCVD